MQADLRLVKRCVDGEVAAWEELYAQCHEPLCTSIRAMLGRHGDANLVDEIAARVWYAVVNNDGELLARYTPKRGARLITFLRTLARDEMGRYFRGEVRRHQREQAAMQDRPPPSGVDFAQTMGLLREFLGTLSVGEREFCQDHLLAQPNEGQTQHTSASIWQRTRRIYKKFLRFLDGREE